MTTLSARRDLLIAFGLTATIALLFSAGLHGFFVWDDRSILLARSTLRDPASFLDLLSTPFWGGRGADSVDVSAVYSLIHRPAMKAYFHLGLRAFGMSPFPFHVASLAMHLVCVLLVYDFLRSRIPIQSRSRELFAALGALTFGLHPTRVEAVSWMTGVPDVAMTMFLLLGVAILRRGDRPVQLALAAISLAMAGFSKETAVLAPILIGLDAFAEGVARRVLVRRVAAGAVASAVVMFAWARAMGHSPAAIPDFGIGLFERVAGTLGAYVERVFVPVPATLFPATLEPLAGGRVAVGRFHIVVGSVALLSFAAAIVAAVRRASLRWLAADVAWFVVPLVPVANIVMRSSTSLIADRYLYLPILGVLAIGIHLADRAARSEWIRPSVSGLGIIAVAVLCAIEDTASIPRFANGRALFEHEARLHPDLSIATEELLGELEAGREYRAASDLALNAAERADARRDPFATSRFILAYVRAEVLRTPEYDQETLASLRRVLDGVVSDHRVHVELGRLRYDRRLPDDEFAVVSRNVNQFRLPLAIAHVKTLDLEGALMMLDAILRESPRRVPVVLLRALVVARRGDFEGAIRCLIETDALVGGDVRLRSLATGLRDIAQRARRRIDDPVVAIVRDADVSTRLGGPEAARRLLDPVLNADPSNVDAIAAYALADASDGRRDAALRRLDDAIARLGAPRVLVQIRAGIATQDSGTASSSR